MNLEDKFHYNDLKWLNENTWVYVLQHFIYLDMIKMWVFYCIYKLGKSKTPITIL